MVKFLNTTPLPSGIFWRWGMNIFLLIPSLSMKFFNDRGLFFYKYLQTKHKKLIFSATIHLTRKKFILPGRYLKADHFEEKIRHGWWTIQNC